jgi:hypothetical protein
MRAFSDWGYRDDAGRDLSAAELSPTVLRLQHGIGARPLWHLHAVQAAAIDKDGRSLNGHGRWGIGRNNRTFSGFPWCVRHHLVRHARLAQRSVYQLYILVLQVLTLGGLSLVSERGVLDGHFIAYALPGVAGAYLGLQVFQKLNDVQFRKLVNLALIVSGIALALK